MKKLIVMCGLTCLIVHVDRASATIVWEDWSASQVGFSNGTASGMIAAPEGPISVSYTGEVSAATQITGGINYWVPNTPYLSVTVPNEPPASDVIALSGGFGITSRLTFSQPVTDPLMAILSLGTPAITVNWVFNRPFDVLSFGPGWWPGPGTLTELPGNVLQGVEGHGVIQFHGTFSTLNWTIPTGEYWNGFTIGLVPEPSSFFLIMLGVAAATSHRRTCKVRH